MAFGHGKKTIFKLAPIGTPTTPTDISTYLIEVQFPRTVDMAETSTFGATDKTYLAGLIDKTFPFSGILDPTQDALLSALLGADNAGIGFAFEYGAMGSTTGNPKYSANGTTAGLIVQTYQTTSPIGDRVSFTGTLQGTGPVTRGTY